MKRSPELFCSLLPVVAGTILSLLSGSAMAESHGSDLPLPSWENAASKELNLGGLLFPEGSGTEMLSPPITRPGDDGHSFSSEFPAAQPDRDLSLFLPDAILGKVIHPPQHDAPTAPENLRECSPSFLAACRKVSAIDYVIDPVGHVPKAQREDLSHFLEFHAKDARVKAFLLVIGRDEKIPDAAQLADIASGALVQKDACLAVYPLGEPWRARLFVNGNVGQLTGLGELNAMADDCARDAAQTRDPLEQMHRFSVRLSIRLFWLERLLSPKQAMAESFPASGSAEESVRAATPAAPHAVAKARHSKRVEWSSIALGVALSLACGGLTFAGLRISRRRNLNRVWMLPEIEIPPRLGGAFSGGGGAMIHYR